MKMFLKLGLMAILSVIGYTKAFEFTFDPIDVVIPCHPKDKITLDMAIDGARKNVKNVRRIITVSAEPLTDKAEWFDEKKYPFTKETIAYEIFKNEEEAQNFLNHPKTRIGWIYQQFLKIYSSLVIPDISKNVLILDADTIFLRPVSFQDDETGAGLYNPGSEHTHAYFAHNEKVLPGWKKIFPQYSGISHHMLHQKNVVTALFDDIKNAHNQEPWLVFCNAVDKSELFRSCMCVEYELYFNYVFAQSDKVKIRHLKWDNIPLGKLNALKDKGYHFLSCHHYMR